MNQSNTAKNRLNGATMGLAVGAGSALSAVLGTLTGNWHWLPIILSACIGLAGIAVAVTHWLTSLKTIRPDHP